MTDYTKTLVERLRTFPQLQSPLSLGGQQINTVTCDPRDPLRLEAAATIERLERELAEARRDAERYRAIRDDRINPMRMFAAQADDELMVGVESMLAGSELDAAIDAAIAKENAK